MVAKSSLYQKVASLPLYCRVLQAIAPVLSNAFRIPIAHRRSASPNPATRGRGSLAKAIRHRREGNALIG